MLILRLCDARTELCKSSNCASVERCLDTASVMRPPKYNEVRALPEPIDCAAKTIIDEWIAVALEQPCLAHLLGHFKVHVRADGGPSD
jgi:hypothetical protein